jgi:hypothetical protein
MSLRLSRPSGKPSWPFLLIAGGPGTGKTYLSCLASASQLVDETYVLTLGEIRPEEYGAIPGAEFWQVEHDGTYESIYQAVYDVAALPRNRRPNLFILDTGSALWDLLVGRAQLAANERAAASAARAKRPAPEGDQKITGDLWDSVRDDWYRVINLMRTMDGPTIITARMEERSVTQNGVPTAEKAWRIRGESNLPFDVTAVVEMVRPGERVLTKIASAAHPQTEPRVWPKFDVEALWLELGLDRTDVEARQYDMPVIRAVEQPVERDWIAEASTLSSRQAVAKLASEASAARAPRAVIDAIGDRLDSIAA